MQVASVVVRKERAVPPKRISCLQLVYVYAAITGCDCSFNLQAITKCSGRFVQSVLKLTLPQLQCSMSEQDGS